MAKKRWGRRLAVGTALLIGGTGVLAVVLATGGVLWLRTDSGNAFIKDQVLTNAAPAIPNGSLAIAELETDLFTEITLKGLALSDTEGRPLIAADAVVLRYDLSRLLDKRVDVEELVLDRPVVDIGAGEDGVLDILRVLGLDEETEEEEPAAEPAPWIDVPADIRALKVAIVGGDVRYRDLSDPAAPLDLRVRAIDFVGGATVAGRRATLDKLRLDVASIEGLEGVAVPRPLAVQLDAAYDTSQLHLNTLQLDAGGIRMRVDGDVRDVDLETLALDLALQELRLPEGEVEALAGPDFGEDGVLWGDLGIAGTVKGPLSGLEAALDAQTPGGALRLEAGADTTKAVMPWWVKLSTPSLDVDRITPMVPEPVHLNLDLEAKGEGVGGLEDMLVDFQLKARDQVVWNEPLPELRLTGRLDHGSVDLKELYARHAAATIAARGNIGIVDETVFIESLRADVPNLRALSRYGVKGISGRVNYTGSVKVDGFGEGGVLLADGGLTVAGLAVEDAAAIQRISGPIAARVELDTSRVNAKGDLEFLGVTAPSTSVDRLRVDLNADVEPSGVVAADALLELDRLSVADGAVAIDRIRSGESRVRGGVDATGQPWALGELVISDLLFGTAGYAAEGGPIAFAFRDPADPVAQKEDRLAIDFALDRKGDESFFDGDVSGNLVTNEWRIDDLVIAPTDEHPLKATEPVTFRLADGGARDINARLVSEVGIVDVKGAWVPDVTNETDISAVIENVDLAHVAKVFALFVAPDGETGKSALDGLDGVASVSVSAKDNGGPMYVDLGVDLKEVTFPGAVQDLTLEASVRGPQTLPALKARVSGPDGLLVALDGAVPLAFPEGAPQLDCAEPVDLRLLVTPGTLDRFTRIAPAAEMPEGNLSASLQAKGQACDPDLALVTVASLPVGADGERVRVDFDLHRSAGDLRFDGTVEQGLVRILDINGTATTQLSKVFEGAFAGGEMPPTDQLSTFASRFNINVVPLGIPIQSFNAFAELPPSLRGKIGGGINFSGTPSAPAFQGGLVWTGGEVGDVELDDAHLFLTPTWAEDASTAQCSDEVPEPDAAVRKDTPQGYCLDARLGFDRTGELGIAGFLPLRLDLDKGGDQDLDLAGLDISISGDTIPLAALQGTVDGVLDAGGKVAMSGGLTGTLADPKPSLRLGLSEGLLSFEHTGLTYQDISGGIDFDGSRLALQDLSVSAEPIWGVTAPAQRGGKFTVDGEVQLDEGYAPTSIDVLARTKGFWLTYTPEYQLRVDSRIKITGAYPQLDVKGRTEILDGKVRLGKDVFLSSSALELDPVLTVHRKNVETKKARKRNQDGPDLVSEMALDLKVDLSRGLGLHVAVPLDSQSGATAALSTATVEMLLLSPELDISMARGEVDPSIAGEVTLDRGSLELLGKDFDISNDSTLTFTGADYANPVLNIEAVHHAGQYGDVSTIVRGTPSSPEISFESNDYPDQTDIVSILIMGKPASELTESEGQAGAGMLLAAASMAAGQALGGASSFLSNVELDEEAVRVGVPLTDKTFLAFERANNAEEDENVFSVSLEWIINRRMYAEMITGDRGQSSADVYMRWRF